MKLINKNYILLFFFHSLLSLIFNIISYLPILKGLHNQKGIWNFMRDSSLYHFESLILLDYLNSKNFSEYLLNFNDHINTKLIAFFYMIFQFNLPISYIPFHSFLWVCSIALVFKTTNILFNRRAAIISVIPFFYISYLTLYMGLLRESLSVLGYALYIFSSVDIYKNKIKIKTIVLFILAFIILLLVRPFLIPIIFLFSIILLIYFKYKGKINFRYLSVILISMVFCISINPRSFNALGWYDEHLGLLSNFYDIFANEEEILTKNRSYKETEFLSGDWITNEINKNLNKDLNKNNFYTSDFTYEFLKSETRSLYLQDAIKNIIKISIFYKIKNKNNVDFDYVLITVLNKILNELIRFNKYETKRIIKEILDIKISTILNESDKKETENINELNVSDKKEINESEKKETENLNELNVSDNKNIIDRNIIFSKCLFGQMSSLALRLNIIRANFNYVKVQPGSKSSDLILTNLCDILYFLPKISADAFLSPYPNMWFEKGIETGRVGRLISGIETIVTYTFLISCFFILLYKKSKIFHLYPILLCCIFIMLLTAFAVPNYGALYRMRMGPLIIFFIIGSLAYDLLISRFFNENKK